MLAPSVTSSACPALVLNADYRPLSYYPLSLWCWQDTIKAVFLERVNILEEYDREVRSPSLRMIASLPNKASPRSNVGHWSCGIRSSRAHRPGAE